MTEPVTAAFNGRFSGTPQPTGTQTAAFQLFDAIIRTRRAIEIVVFADPRFPGVEDGGQFLGPGWSACRFKAGPGDVPSFGNKSGSHNFVADGRANLRTTPYQPTRSGIRDAKAWLRCMT